ncbi:MAG: nicotinate-nucleotide adenylyltransferase [Planctomycetota bacterium]|jgi:nicotinate-nucleotide adenylyltransferase
MIAAPPRLSSSLPDTLIAMAPAGHSPDETLKQAEPPLVFCPLGFERRAFLRFGKLPVVTTGPGPGGIRRAFATRDSWPVRNPRFVVLLGLAGSLDPRLEPGTDHGCAEVVSGGSETPPLRSSLVPGATARVVECASVATTPDAKARLAAATRAQLVDMESHAFASCAEAAGLRWGIMRGVSDGADEWLPPELARLVDASGETRVLRVLAAIARRPSLVPALMRIGRTSRLALRNASFTVDALGARSALELCDAAHPLILYGGSFDPPHARHATMLADAMRSLKSPCAIVMPARINPLKSDTPPADGDARLAMCRAAFGSIGAEVGGEIRLSRLELDREGPSYTIDTVTALCDRTPSLRGAIRFLVGSDAIRSIERWHRWRELLELARPAVVVRPPDTRDAVAAFLAEFARSSGFADAPSWLLDLAPVEIASTDLRVQIARGERPSGISDAVWLEITARRLYGFGGGR